MWTTHSKILTVHKGECNKFNLMGFNFVDCQSKLPYKGVQGEFTVAPLLKLLCTSYVRSHWTKFDALVRHAMILAKFLHKTPD